MGGLYAANVHWVNVKAMRWQDFEEVDLAHRSHFDFMPKGVQQRLLVVQCLTPVAP